MDERLYRGLEEFNEERFFEAHEVLEDLWHEYRDTDRTFIQGLIQIAAAFYHVQSRNFKGAVSQFTKGNEKLAHFLPAHNNVSVAKLLDDVRETVRRIQQTTSLSIDTVTYPKIQYTRIAKSSNPGS